MKFIKHFFVIGLILFTQSTCAAQDIKKQITLVLTAKEIQQIQTDRILESLTKILDDVEKTKDWSIFSNATNPSRSEILPSASILFAQTLQTIIDQYATCTQVEVPTFFGLSQKIELNITDNKNSDLKIFSNKDFLKLLDRAITLLEKESSTHSNYNIYKTYVQIAITAKNTLDLHEIHTIIKKNVDKAVTTKSKE